VETNLEAILTEEISTEEISTEEISTEAISTGEIFTTGEIFIIVENYEDLSPVITVGKM